RSLLRGLLLALRSLLLGGLPALLRVLPGSLLLLRRLLRRLHRLLLPLRRLLLRLRGLLLRLRRPLLARAFLLPRCAARRGGTLPCLSLCLPLRLPLARLRLGRSALLPGRSGRRRCGRSRVRGLRARRRCALGIVRRLRLELLAGHREEQCLAVARDAKPLVRHADVFLADAEHTADADDGLDHVVLARDDQILDLAEPLAFLVQHRSADQVARAKRAAGEELVIGQRVLPCPPLLLLLLRLLLRRRRRPDDRCRHCGRDS